MRSAWMRCATPVLVTAFWLAGGAPPSAQQRPQPAAGLDVLQIQPNFYLIAGVGANVAVQIGTDGVVIVDAGSETQADQVLAEIRKLTRQPIRYIINTNADPDHVGGNDKLSAAGQSIIPTGGLNDIASAGGRAVIFAEENVLARMSAPVGQQSAYPAGAWPTASYSTETGEKQKDLYLNGEAIQVLSQPAAHTDGDSAVFFRRSDVLVTGDVLDTTRFPVVDLEKGGSIQGIIDSLNRLIVIAVSPTPLVWQEGGTVVIPGHGRLCDKSELVDYRDMLTIIRDRVQDGIKKGQTLDQIQRGDPSKGYRKRYGAESGPWTTSMFVEAVYKSLTK